MERINEIKSEVQEQIHAIWYQTGRRGTVVAGTGTGKSRIAIMEIERMLEAGVLSEDDIGNYPVLLVTPTTKLRDENWPAEFADWGASELFTDFVKPICFASLKNERSNHYKLVILDEIHHLTDLAATAFRAEESEGNAINIFFSENLADSVMGLTATIPDPVREPEKAAIIFQVSPVVFTYSLDQGIEDGMIADYEIRVIQGTLDNVAKIIPAGTKKKPFMTTEQKHYEYLEKMIRKWRMLCQKELDPRKAASFDRLAMFATMTRNRFIYNLPSKTRLAERCLRYLTGNGRRTLVFCGSIEQCDKLLGDRVYHSKSGNEAFEAFNAKKIDTLGVVNAANEGINFVDPDQALIIQANSNFRNMVQRVGRLLRVRPGHKGLVYVQSVLGTADERWVDKSLSQFDPGKITYYGEKSVPL